MPRGKEKLNQIEINQINIKSNPASYNQVFLSTTIKDV